MEAIYSILKEMFAYKEKADIMILILKKAA